MREGIGDGDRDGGWGWAVVVVSAWLCVCVSLSRGSQEVNYRQILDVCVSQQRFTRSKLWSIL